MLQCHPDVCPASERPHAEEAFRQASEAYARLTGREYLHLSGCPAAAVRQPLTQCLHAGTPVQDWEATRAKAPPGAYYAQKAKPKHFSHGAVAGLLVMPLLFAGVYIGRCACSGPLLTSCHSTQSYGERGNNAAMLCRSYNKLQDLRPDGLMQPPQNPYLRPDLHAHQQESWFKRLKSYRASQQDPEHGRSS